MARSDCTTSWQLLLRAGFLSTPSAIQPRVHGFSNLKRGRLQQPFTPSALPFQLGQFGLRRSVFSPHRVLQARACTQPTVWYTFLGASDNLFWLYFLLCHRFFFFLYWTKSFGQNGSKLCVCVEGATRWTWDHDYFSMGCIGEERYRRSVADFRILWIVYTYFFLITSFSRSCNFSWCNAFVTLFNF